jgi:hypothetical protein
MKKIFTLGILIIGSLFITQSVFAEFNFSGNFTPVLMQQVGGKKERIEKGISYQPVDETEKVTINIHYIETFSGKKKTPLKAYYRVSYNKFDWDPFENELLGHSRENQKFVYTPPVKDMFDKNIWYTVQFYENLYSKPVKYSNPVYAALDSDGKLVLQTNEPSSPQVQNKSDLFKFTDINLSGTKLSSTVSLATGNSDSDISVLFKFCKSNPSLSCSVATESKINAKYINGNNQISNYTDKKILENNPVSLLLDIGTNTFFTKQSFYSVDITGTDGDDTYTGIKKYLLIDSNGTMSLQTTAPTAAQIAALKVAPTTNPNRTTPPINTGTTPPINTGTTPPSLSTGNSVITLKNPLKFDSIPAILGAIVTNVVLPIAVPIFIIMLIYCGIKFVLARGNATKLQEAREALKWTLIGGAVILGSYAIAELVASTIGAVVGK